MRRYYAGNGRNAGATGWKTKVSDHSEWVVVPCVDTHTVGLFNIAINKSANLIRIRHATGWLAVEMPLTAFRAAYQTLPNEHK